MSNIQKFSVESPIDLEFSTNILPQRGNNNYCVLDHIFVSRDNIFVSRDDIIDSQESLKRSQVSFK